MKKPKIAYIKGLDYSSFVALCQECNRPSGGIRTVQTVAVNSHLSSTSRVLEIGSTTGFTSINLAYLVKCSVLGIDINAQAVNIANERAKQEGLEKICKFQKGDATKLPFLNNFFDLVWCSNVPSFIKERSKCIEECIRVLKFGGTYAAVPIYYVKSPPEDLIRKVSKAINTDLPVFTKDSWHKIITTFGNKSGCHLELFYSQDLIYKDQSHQIQYFVQKLMEKPHLARLSTHIKREIRKKALGFYRLFNENLKYAGFSIMLYQKRKIADEPELFLTQPCR